MPGADEPYRREELLGALDRVHREASELFRAGSDDDFFRHPEDGVWSPAENVIHLVKSVQAVASAVKLPKLALAVLFGRSASGSRSYSEVREDYLERLAKGGSATGRYVPASLSPGTPEEAAQSRSRALAGWERAGADLIRALGRWSESALDRYRLPHPLLGKLTVREMLFFTHYHDLHHIGIVERRSGEVGADG